MFRSKTTGPPGVAVVTGGSAGIGRASVRELAGRGWDVAVLARGQDRIDETVREVHGAGRRGLLAAGAAAAASALIARGAR